MGNGDEQRRRRRQIERLLAYPGVGPLSAPAIARNLGTSPEGLEPLLDGLVAEGRLARTNDGRFAAPAGERSSDRDRREGEQR